MIELDRLALFLGHPYALDSGLRIFSPTVNDISSVGYQDYMIKLTLCSFDKNMILSDLFGVSNDAINEISELDDFEILTSEEAIRNHIASSLSFFVHGEVEFDPIYQAFMLEDRVLISRNNYLEIADVIKQLNCSKAESEKLNTTSSKAKEMLKKMMMFEQKQKKQDDGLDFKDILSVLCAANGNGIDIFNVKNLTIYQVYEQFERLTTKDSFDRILPVWANGHLGKDDKLPEWIKKTKL
ncbi:hypothetical protein MKY95_19605 [Paenibacillus sp. FSL P4-0176]|uniref:hypothetical protein n=1 Tax=Paenibacillus sp. FSL P4-0176 TaxID=2921631 RepID=UPI0030D02188